MSQDTKEAIQAGLKKLEQDRKEKLQREVYEYLKVELDSIDYIDQQIRDLNTKKKVHEENVKNIKQGNIEAIERRSKSLDFNGTITVANGLMVGSDLWLSGTINGPRFYTDYVAGITYTTGSGKTYIF